MAMKDWKYQGICNETAELFKKFAMKYEFQRSNENKCVIKQEFTENSHYDV